MTTEETQAVEEIGGDWLLALFAKLAQENGFDMVLTLGIRGQTLCGVLVGRDRWFDELAAAAELSGPGAVSLLAPVRDTMQRLLLDRPADAPVPYGYLHLLDGQVVGDPLSHRAMWRVRITEVSSWSLQDLRRDL